MGAKKTDNGCCKWCRKPFASTPNPIVKNPGPKDLLKRRTPVSNECRPCFSFQGSDAKYSNMSKPELASHLQSETGFNEYSGGLEEYCAQRRDGKRVRKETAAGVSLGIGGVR